MDVVLNGRGGSSTEIEDVSFMRVKVKFPIGNVERFVLLSNILDTNNALTNKQEHRNITPKHLCLRNIFFSLFLKKNLFVSIIMKPVNFFPARFKDIHTHALEMLLIFVSVHPLP